MTTRLHKLSKVAPKKCSSSFDSVAYSKRNEDRHRAFDILMQAENYWLLMDRFRRDRERNKRYTYGDQWGDIVETDKGRMTEEDYIKSMGNIPLKNNLIRKLVRTVVGVYRSQSKEPTCTARDRDEQRLSETMSTILQCNMQLNRMDELLARSMEEFLISGMVVHRKSFGWRNEKLDCWTDYVQPNNFFIDSNMRDPRGWDVSFLGEIHDVPFGTLCEQFADSVADCERFKEIYKYASDRNYYNSLSNEFGYRNRDDFSFLYSQDPSLCRVIEVWRKEQKPRYRCHDYLSGDIFKIDIEDYQTIVAAENESRLAQAAEVGIDSEEVPLIVCDWFVDDYWYFYYLSPFGDILKEGETPYEHKSHPYIFKVHPFIDGEVHSLVGDVVDQQRYVNRLITLNDWIMRASAKGVLLVPNDCIPENMDIKDFAESWTEFNGVIVYKPSKSGQIPQQVATNSTNIGISELLNVQLKFFEDISGVNNALQGKPGFSGESAAHFNQQTQNATYSLLDLLESFSRFVQEGAYKDVKNMQQFYTDKRIFNIVGKNAQVEYDPKQIGDIEFDLNVIESTATPAYRMLANDLLMQLYQTQAISVEQLLEHGDFPFADDLLQSIKSQKEQLQQGKTPEGISPQLLQQAQQNTDMQAVNQLGNAVMR